MILILYMAAQKKEWQLYQAMIYNSGKYVVEHIGQPHSLCFFLEEKNGNDKS